MPVTKPRITGKVVRARVAAKLSPLATELSLCRSQLADVGSTLDMLKIEHDALRTDLANVSEALAEAAWLLDRCVPGRFRDRELAPRIRAFCALAGNDAVNRVQARLDKLPTLGTPTSTGKACNVAPPEMYSATHAPCHWNAGHGGDHLWKALAFDVTGRSE